MPLEIDIDTSGIGRAFDAAEAFYEAQVQRSMLTATRRGAERLQGRLRGDMASAGLAGLGRAFRSVSDDQRGGVYQRADGFSASAAVLVGSRSERTRGAIEAYTGGAQIRPRRGRWLWIPTDAIARVAGPRSNRQRVTPANWSALGMDAKVGPLELVRSVNGRPLLVVKGASVAASGARRSAKSLTKTGRLRKGQVAKPFVVAFVAIPSTSRQARIDPRALQRQVMAELPTIFASEMQRA